MAGVHPSTFQSSVYSTKLAIKIVRKFRCKHAGIEIVNTARCSTDILTTCWVNAAYQYLDINYKVLSILE